MKPMLPKDHHCCHRIVNVGIDAVVAILANGTFFFWWRFWPWHRHLMAPLVPFKCLQMWPPMAIANDESHWRQWWWGAPFVPSNAFAIGNNGSPFVPFLLPLATMAPMARCAIRYNTFTCNSIALHEFQWRFPENGHFSNFDPKLCPQFLWNRRET